MEPQQLSSDRISTLPQHIIEAILCLVPFRKAVSTSILSKKWRYNWAKIPNLLLDTEDMFLVRPRTGNDYDDIKKVLFLHEGPIQEFTFILDIYHISVEIDQIITHLSRNNNTTLKKFKLDLGDHHRHHHLLYRLPLSIFSFHRLTNLYLQVCDLDFEPTFSGFGCLTSLHLEDVRVTTKTLLHLLSKSPLLKSFTLCSFEDVIPRELSVSLVHLKYFYFDDICFVDKYGLPFLVLLIKCSPNLQRFKLRIDPELAKRFSQSEIDSVTFENYSDICLEHLNELEIKEFANLKPELEFVKLILARSPVLKKLRISLYEKVTKDEELEMLRVLLRSTRASPAVKIFVEPGV